MAKTYFKGKKHLFRVHIPGILIYGSALLPGTMQKSIICPQILVASRRKQIFDTIIDSNNRWLMSCNNFADVFEIKKSYRDL